MKKIQTLLILLLTIMLTIVCLTACTLDLSALTGGTPSTDKDDPAEDTDDTQNAKKKKYLITFQMHSGTFSQMVTEGEIPVPPEEEEIATDNLIRYITGWDKEIVAVTEATTYKAQYGSRARTFTVTYKSYNSEIVQTDVEYRAIPDPPTTVEAPEGSTFVCWDLPARITEDTVITAVYANYLDVDTMNRAFEMDLIKYSETGDDNDDGVQDMSTALLCLALEEYYNPMGLAVSDRILEHLRNLIAGGNEPHFDAKAYWSYPLLTGAIALAKKTPTVWNELTKDEVARLDLIMRSFAVLGCFATDDQNDYKTGPGLSGNFSKGWNPNYRLANVLPMVFCKAYFGSTEAVNALFGSFSYDAYIKQFESYGFTRAKACWSKPTRTETTADGTEVTIYGCRDLFTNGGATWCYNSTADNVLMDAGSGVGVKNNPYYSYNKCTLDDIAGIIRSLYEYNYSGGLSRNEQVGKDGEVIAYTDVENAEAINAGPNPMLGLEGMMRELGHVDRSSLGYCSHDFMLVLSSLETMRALDMYDITEHFDLYRKVIVGNEDFLYKSEVGYYNYINVWYANGVKQERTDEADCEEQYFMWKAIWREYYLDHPDDVKLS